MMTLGNRPIFSLINRNQVSPAVSGTIKPGKTHLAADSRLRISTGQGRTKKMAMIQYQELCSF